MGVICAAPEIQLVFINEDCLDPKTQPWSDDPGPYCLHLSGKRILVVHESAEIGEALSDVFSAAGAHVEALMDHQSGKIVLWGNFDMLVLDASNSRTQAMLDDLQRCRPDLLSRTIVITNDLRGTSREHQLISRHPGAIFCDSWLVDLVNLARRVIASNEQRLAA